MDVGNKGGLRREAAVAAGDHVLAADDRGEADDPLRHELRVLHDVCRVSDDAGDEDLARWQLHVLEDAPLVRVPWVRYLERVGAGVDPQHQVDDVGQGHVVHARAFVDAVARVEAHLLLGDAAQGVVQRIDVGLGEPALLGAAFVALEEAGERRVVDLEDEAGTDDGEVLLTHRLGDGEEVLLLGLVVLVDAQSLGRRRRHEGLEGAGFLRRRLQVGDVGLDGGLPFVADGTRANQRQVAADPPARARPEVVGLVVVREGAFFLRPAPRGPRPSLPRLEAGQALAGVGVEAVLALLAVRDDVDAALDLLLDALLDGGAHAAGRRLLGEGGARRRCLHHLEDVGGPGEAANVGGDDPVGATSHPDLKRRDYELWRGAAAIMLAGDLVVNPGPARLAIPYLRSSLSSTQGLMPTSEEHT